MLIELVYLMLVLFALNFAAAAAEVGFISSRASKIKSFIFFGKLSRIVSQNLANKRAPLVSVCLLVSNISNIFLSSIVTYIAVVYFPDVQHSITVMCLAMGVFLFVFGEAIPKTLALHNPEIFGLTLYPVFTLFHKIFIPIIFFTNRISQFIVHYVFPKDEDGNEEDKRFAINELKLQIRSQDEKKGIPNTEKYMIDGVLDLGSIDVEVIMTHRTDVIGIDISGDIGSIIDTIKKSPYSRLPLYKKNLDNVIGVIHVKDVLQHLLDKFEDSGKKRGSLLKSEIKKLMVQPSYVLRSKDLRSQLVSFKSGKPLHCVIDEYGGMMGIVTLEDLIEEIVGDIKDESDMLEEDFECFDDEKGNIRVVGDFSVRDFCRRFNIDLPYEEIVTISGLVIDYLGRVPRVSESFKMFGLNCTVLEASDMKIDLLQIKMDKGCDDSKKESNSDKKTNSADAKKKE